MKTLNLENIKFDCVLCLNSDLPELNIFEKIKGIPIIAADGAANRLQEIGITPDYIVGDLDSFENSIYFQTFPEERIIRNADQNSSDFEKIVSFALSNNYRTGLIIGFHGGDLEHTLNNWSVLMKISKFLNVCLLDKNRHGIPVFSDIKLNVRIGETISLLPAPMARLTTQGLKWELNDEYLKFGVREGARNEAVIENPIIELSEGALLIFLDLRI